ncbi:MAG: NAD(+) kinase [Woeseiaceae bacterium]|nr:NAD(+) kinase [Woeseiaceae bacterium]NIP20200.1 NAD(+) kinase [Woeseiaceae bacterium]NIS88996.1 NAD(+) kinase [Woeseiaceae bacterium]
MGDPFNKIAILGRREDPRVAGPVDLLVTHLTKAGVEVVDDTEIEGVDLVIAIGGDGTMLYAGSRVRDYDIPLLGINRGRLGFLADVTPAEMLSSVDHILAGEYTVEARLLLDGRLDRAAGENISGTAFNDIVLQRHDTGRMVDFEASVAGQFVNTHSGDGIIVATPTGSTAYALSCGGPIVEPKLDAVVIVPICPHTLTDRPLVIDANQAITIRLLERDESGASVSIDGHSIGAIAPGDTLTVTASEKRIRLIHPPGYDFYGILRSKLLWGRDSRMRTFGPAD